MAHLRAKYVEQSFKKFLADTLVKNLKKQQLKQVSLGSEWKVNRKKKKEKRKQKRNRNRIRKTKKEKQAKFPLCQTNEGN